MRNYKKKKVSVELFAAMKHSFQKKKIKSYSWNPLTVESHNWAASWADTNDTDTSDSEQHISLWPAHTQFANTKIKISHK